MERRADRARVVRDRHVWTQQIDYDACQTPPQRARHAQVEVIRSASVREAAADAARTEGVAALDRER